jgi:ankyrin repeat protein
MGERGNTPLTLAAQAGFVGVVRSLYHMGADINHKNLAGKSASNLAKEGDQTKVLKSQCHGVRRRRRVARRARHQSA